MSNIEYGIVLESQLLIVYFIWVIDAENIVDKK